MTAALIDRRMLLAAGLMVPAAAIAARLAPPDTALNAAAIRWPLGAGREMHGYMAIPARARGRQPAVLVIGGRDTPDAAARALVRAAAQAGFVSCTANTASLIDDRLADDMAATAQWLANGRYGTGRIGAVGLAGGLAATSALAAGPALRAAVLYGDAAPVGGATPTLAFRQRGDGWSAEGAPGVEWSIAWDQGMAFLRAKLT